MSRIFHLLHSAKLAIQNPKEWGRRREINRLRAQPRYTAGVSHLPGFECQYVDALSFVYIYREIFGRQLYRFKASGPKPLILDCGANIGLSVCYFKQLYPESEVIAFEPDPVIFKVLQQNVARAGRQGVTLKEAAIWKENGELVFMQEGSDAGRVTSVGQSFSQRKVPALRLLDYLDREVDLLKIDIEGAESVVLHDCVEGLRNVKKLFVEYHSFLNEKQVLPELLELLRQAGFRFFCDQPCEIPQPLFEIKPYLGMDFQLNIYAYRPDSHGS
jgi:FkbM family methyltransferase